MNSKLCLVTLDYPPQNGGVARYLGSLVNAAQGDIEVIVPRGMETTGPGQVTSKRLFWSLWPHWWPMVNVIRKRRKTHQVVLVSHVFPVGTAAWIARKRGGPEYVVICHGLDVRLAQGTWKRWLFQHILRKAKAVVTVSEATKKMVQQIVPDIRVDVIMPGVDPFELSTRTAARQALGLSEDVRVILSIARLIPRKGIDMTIEALAELQNVPIEERIRDKYGMLLYAVLGEGADHTRLQARADELGIKVRWLGATDEETKQLWLAASDVFVLPVRDTGNDVEGFGIVYLEAAMASLPSVAGQSGGAVEAVVEGVTGLVVKPEDPKAIAEAIQSLLQDEDRRELLGAQGRVRAQRGFSWRDRWDKLKSLVL